MYLLLEEFTANEINLSWGYFLLVFCVVLFFFFNSIVREPVKYISVNVLWMRVFIKSFSS